MKKKISYAVYWLVQLTWGCFATALGLVGLIFFFLAGERVERVGPNLQVRVGRSWGGLSLGPINFTCTNVSKQTILHECGHSRQNFFWGPLFLFVIGIPSVIRYWYREYQLKIKKINAWMLPDYDAIWFEGQATEWGYKYYINAYNVYLQR